MVVYRVDTHTHTHRRNSIWAKASPLTSSPTSVRSLSPRGFGPRESLADRFNDLSSSGSQVLLPRVGKRAQGNGITLQVHFVCRVSCVALVVLCLTRLRTVE